VLGLGEVTEERELKQSMIDCMIKLYDRGMMTGVGGNISARLPGAEEVWISPSGLYKPSLGTEDLLKIDFEGRLIEGIFKASMEWPFHVAIYKRRTDVNCVLHCHPPVATGLTLANVRIKPITLEAALMIAKAPVVPFIYPGTKELGDAVAQAALGSRVILLQNHGAVTVGYDLHEALTAMEILEEAATMTLVSRTVGAEPAEIGEKDIELIKKLYKI